jgi:hypothetical protein
VSIQSTSGADAIREGAPAEMALVSTRYTTG